MGQIVMSLGNRVNMLVIKHLVYHKIQKIFWKLINRRIIMNYDNYGESIYKVFM
jgi:hypothetical protein